MVTGLVPLPSGNSTLPPPQGNPNDRLSGPHCCSSRTVSLWRPIQLRQGLQAKTKSQPQPLLGLTGPGAVGTMVNITCQAFLCQVLQIWSQCSSLPCWESLFLSYQQQDKRWSHHLPAVQPLCLPQCRQVQVRQCVPQMWRGAPFLVRRLQRPHHLKDITRIHPSTWLALSLNCIDTLTKRGVHAYSTLSNTVPRLATTAPGLHEFPKTWNQLPFTPMSLTTSYTVNAPRATWQDPTTTLPFLTSSAREWGSSLRRTAPGAW